MAPCLKSFESRFGCRYCLQVDARYPYVGKREFSNSKALSPPFVTPFPARPPLQPTLVRLDADEEVDDVLPEEEVPSLNLRT